MQSQLWLNSTGYLASTTNCPRIRYKLIWSLSTVRDKMKFSFNPKEFHHLYFGVLMILGGGVWGILTSSSLALLLLLLGMVVAADDVEQHYVQATYPEYRSLMHRLFQYLWVRVFGSWWPFKNL
jgi:hypothetical protein